MAEEKKYYLRVQGCLVEVTKDVYRAYYCMERHTRTLDEKDIRNGKVVFVKGKVKRKGTKKLSGRSTCSLGPWARHMSLFNAPVRNFPCSS